ncbi:hypothetical protein DFH29DRAFT_888450 [Suillus ampliporus]|nr:hypothetical protein DFH29DRAFT_888450 [Suillus ampliporus]
MCVVVARVFSDWSSAASVFVVACCNVHTAITKSSSSILSLSRCYLLWPIRLSRTDKYQGLVRMSETQRVSSESKQKEICRKVSTGIFCRFPFQGYL